jgi:hypothetical protein
MIAGGRGGVVGGLEQKKTTAKKRRIKNELFRTPQQYKVKSLLKRTVLTLALPQQICFEEILNEEKNMSPI